MKYVAKRKWRKAEEEGNFTDVAELLLDEIKCNCDKVPSPSLEYGCLQELYSSFMYANK